MLVNILNRLSEYFSKKKKGVFCQNAAATELAKIKFYGQRSTQLNCKWIAFWQHFSMHLIIKSELPLWSDEIRFILSWTVNYPMLLGNMLIVGSLLEDIAQVHDVRILCRREEVDSLASTSQTSRYGTLPCRTMVMIPKKASRPRWSLSASCARGW